MNTNRLITILDSVDSTNNYAMQQVHAGMAKHGMAWVAKEQLAGKGQRGKVWQAAPGQNIAMSLVLEPISLKLADQFCLSMAVALACRHFFNQYAGGNTFIKWPNDIYWNDRKAAGILIESVIGASNGGNWKWAVIGIGINLNQTAFDPTIPNPISLQAITGKTYDLVEMATELHENLLQAYDRLLQEPYEKLEQDYCRQLYKLQHKQTLKKGDQVFDSIIQGVNRKGQLLTKDTIERSFEFGEVEWIID